MFQGSIVALVTPMKADGQIDYTSLIKLVEWHLQSGTSAIVAIGSTGESASLTRSEHIAVVEAVVDKVAGRFPVIAGNGTSDTASSIELTKQMKQAGADACLCVTPYYIRPTQEGLYRHYTEVANCEDIPQILYNVPGRTGVDLLPETVARLAPHENIVALKEATACMERLRELIELVDDKLDLLSGDDASCREFILSGGKGVVSVTANVAPELMSQMCHLALAKEAGKSLEIDEKLVDLHKALSMEPNPIPVKWALTKMGKITNNIRLPLLPLSGENHSKMVAALLKAQITLQ